MSNVVTSDLRSTNASARGQYLEQREPSSDKLTASEQIVSVRGLSISFDESGVSKTVVDHLSFHIHRGESVGIVGESGSGKSVTVRTLLGLRDSHESVTSDEYTLFGRNVQGFSDAE
jgi:ABC-type glutathione transport system ATPase component